MLRNHIRTFAQIATMSAEQLVKHDENGAAANHRNQQSDDMVDFSVAVCQVGIGQCDDSRGHQFNGQGRYQSARAKATHGANGAVCHRGGDAHYRAQDHGTRSNRTQNSCPYQKGIAHVSHRVSSIDK